MATSAANQRGIDELWAAIESQRKHRESAGKAQAQAEQRLKDETAEVVAEMARQRALETLAGDGRLVERLLEDGTPYGVAEEILRELG